MNSPKYRGRIVVFTIFEIFFLLLNVHAGWGFTEALVRSTLSSIIVISVFYVLSTFFCKREKGRSFDEHDSKK